MQRALATRQRALETELEQLHLANASALAKLEAEQRAAAESMRSAGQALQAVIDNSADFDAFDAEVQTVECERLTGCWLRRAWRRWNPGCRLYAWPPNACNSRQTEWSLAENLSCWRTSRVGAPCPAALFPQSKSPAQLLQSSKVFLCVVSVMTPRVHSHSG